MSSATTLSPSHDDARAALALTLVADVGSVTHRALVERFGTAARVLGAAFPPAVVRAAMAHADVLMARGSANGLALTSSADTEYPASLRDLHDPPPVLWSRGHWEALQAPVVAIVGTRRATSYGHRVTRALVSALSRGGACVVSGMALGIDAAAHSAVLESCGRTVAVLGTGADVAYPRANITLHREISDRGLVLSELPPESRSDAGSFPRRNRIIAALASLTIVIEAPVRSGALITARCALELGRDVAAVPGPIDVPQSEGTNELIRDGAHAITSVSDALSLIGLDPPMCSHPVIDDESERCIWHLLAEGAATLDELCARAMLPVSHCLAAVTRLELRGIVECALTGHIRRR